MPLPGGTVAWAAAPVRVTPPAEGKPRPGDGKVGGMLYVEVPAVASAPGMAAASRSTRCRGRHPAPRGFPGPGRTGRAGSATSRAGGHPGGGLTIRVLIAGDHQVVRQGLRFLLSSEPGIGVAGEAPDGAAALGAIRALRPDVVLLDLFMPRIDGLAVLAAMREEELPGAVLVLTSSARRG